MAAAGTLPTIPGASTYHRATRTATYGFLASLPLLVAYELMMLLSSAGSAIQVRVGAEIWSKQLLTLLGVRGTAALSLVVVAVGLVIVYLERKKSIPLRARYFGWLIAESTLYALAVAVMVSTVVGWLFAFAQTGAGRPSLFTMLALSIGAGLYEELIFRVILVGGLYLIIRTFYRDGAYVVAAVLGALIFSGVHYIGALGDVFTLSSFTFRFLFGLALNALFLWRGFAIAAWTHALYDILVVTQAAF